PGESVLIEWDVSNLGDSDALGNWQDAVYLSKDQDLSPDEVLLGTSCIPEDWSSASTVPP
ncbi:MAG: hypothetical protein AB7I48_18885, partial [Planctomycetaceae bacterium]